MTLNVIVSDAGFADDDWTGGIVPFGTAANDAGAVDLPADTDPETLRATLAQITMIRIGFTSFADGRGFTLAQRLRRMGYDGRLRACGHVISDQYAMARRSGFDEVEITPELADRQPEAEWKFRADWRAHDYQARLRG